MGDAVDAAPRGMILGIDPGKTGGFALLHPATLTVTTWAMPDTTRGVHELFVSLPPILICGIEKPFYPPQNGPANAGAKGEAYGILKGALAWRDIPFREIRPAEWKQSLSIPTDKTAARQRASEFFPDASDQWRLAKEDGRAEAALIAWFCRKWVAA